MYFLAAFPVSIVQGLPNVALLLTAHGGHIAFLQGLFPRGESYMERLFGQFVQAVFEHPRDIRKACGIKEEKTSWSSFILVRTLNQTRHQNDSQLWTIWNHRQQPHCNTSLKTHSLTLRAVISPRKCWVCTENDQLYCTIMWTHCNWAKLPLHRLRFSFHEHSKKIEKKSRTFKYSRKSFSRWVHAWYCMYTKNYVQHTVYISFSILAFQ